jgi:tetratricopeptide (TPR) repeat protein
MVYTASGSKDGSPMVKSKADESLSEILNRFRHTDHEHAAWESNKDLADSLQDQGHLTDARKLYEVGLSIAERFAGADPNHFGWKLNLETSCGRLAALLHQEADLAGARSLYERGLAIREKAYAHPDPGVATTLNNLATVLYEQGDLAGARPLYERAAAIWDDFNPKDIDAEIVRDNLVHLLYRQGDVASARRFYERTLAMFDQWPDSNSFQIMVIAYKLANVLHHQGDLVSARPLYERALELSEKNTRTDAHVFTAKVLSGLGVLHFDLENPEAGAQSSNLAEARSYLGRALATHEKHLIENVHTALILNNLGAVLAEQGNLVGARSLYERALAIYEKVDPEHPDAARNLDDLARMLNDHDWTGSDLALVLSLYQRALAIREKIQGPQHLDTAYTLAGLAGALMQQGKYRDALPLFERAAQIFLKTLGSEHSQTKICHGTLSLLKEWSEKPSNVVRLSDYSIPLSRRRSRDLFDPGVGNVIITLYDHNKVSPGDVVGETPATKNVGNATKIKVDERGIPLAAPAPWPGKRRSVVSIDVFFRRVWGKYLRKGLTFADITKLDAKLANSMKRHFRDGLPWPEDLKLSNERRALRLALEQFKKGNAEVLSPQQLIAVGRALKRREQTKSRSPRKVARLER